MMPSGACPYGRWYLSANIIKKIQFHPDGMHMAAIWPRCVSDVCIMCVCAAGICVDLFMSKYYCLNLNTYLCCLQSSQQSCDARIRSIYKDVASRKFCIELPGCCFLYTHETFHVKSLGIFRTLIRLVWHWWRNLCLNRGSHARQSGIRMLW